MTRADCFLDQAEIVHGLAVLSEAAQTTFKAKERESFSIVLKALEARLHACFVLSLSQDRDNNHLKSTYAKKNGAILEFQEDFPMIFYGASWHTIPNGNDSWSVRFIVDLYEFFEGFVIYDVARQLHLAEMACQSYRDIRSTDAHPADIYHFIDILMRCMVLFKVPSFNAEKEYRFALIRNLGDVQSFEEAMVHNGKHRAYISVRIPSTDAEIICVRDVQS